MSFLESTRVHGLRVVSKPITVARQPGTGVPVGFGVPEVDSLDHHRVPFVVLDAGDLLEQIFNVAVSPIPTFNGRDRGNICEQSAIYADRMDCTRNVLPAPKAWTWVVNRISAISTTNSKLLDDIAILQSSIDERLDSVRITQQVVKFLDVKKHRKRLLVTSGAISL